jgi:predicted neuraminidase
MRSTDEGLTWEAPQKLHDDWSGCVRNILETRTGRVVFTAMKMRHNPGRHAVLTYCSDDQGKTWKTSNVIDLGGAGHHGGVSEATAIELKDGRLIKFIRTNWMRFWLAESSDGGLTWHPLGPTDVPASSAPGLLQRLASGRIILIWNRPFPEGKDTFPLSGGDRIWSETPVSNHRGELSIAFSEDECKTWSTPVVIARKPGTSLAYPYLFEASPGELWLTTMQGGLCLKLREADFID